MADRIDARNFTIEDIGHGLMKILTALGGAHAVSNVIVDNLKKVKYGVGKASNDYGPFEGYGCGIRYISEAALLSDGRVMVCVTSYEIAGTFASHDDIVTSYYILTPKPGYE